MLVQHVGRRRQFRRRIAALGEQDAVLDVAFRGDDDQQDARFRKMEELDLADARQLATRRDHHAGEMG